MQATLGNTVKVHYTLKDSTGQIVESSKDFIPIEFVIGDKQVICGFEKGVLGMTVGETKTITIQPEDGYGLHDEKKVFVFEKKNAPGNFSPRVGDSVKMHRPDGKSVPVIVVAVTENGFRMDANHPLAGKELIFDLELVEIVKSDSQLPLEPK